MAEYTLIAEPGRATGSSASRRLRADGRIPAVVYGHGVDGISVSVDGRELRHALSGEAGLNQLLSLEVGSDSHLAMARSLQRHPVRHTVLHVDFQIVRRDEVISADVPVILSGEAKAVEQENGIVEQLLSSLAVNATPALIPSNIEVDISDLTVGEGIRVGDLRLPDGVTTDVLPDDLVVMASATRAAVEEAVEEGAEAAEGEAPAASGGVTAAAESPAAATEASGSEEG
jgi:large subunit ribosomal protein L25